MSYLNEAFKELDELVDDVDLQDEDDVKKAIDFLKGDIDNTDHLEMVVDIDAEDEEDLKDSYIGEIILMCPVCHTLHYSTEDNLVHDEEEPDLVNVGDPCPHCKQENGFEIKGKVAEYVPDGEEPKKEDEEDSEEIFDLEDIEDEETDEEKAKVEESFKLRKKYIETISEDNLDDLARFTGIELPTTKRVVESKSKSLKESKLVEKPVYDLNTDYDSRKSFYGKAKVDVDNNGGNKLYSYNTLVAEMKDGKPVVYGTYSQTTLRHIKEWLKQNGFKAESSKQIMNDYGAKQESCKEAVTKQDDIDAQADNKKEVAKQDFEKKIDDADADRDDKLEEAHYNKETGDVEPDYFYGIDDIEVIGHGDSDPELVYKDKTYNYFDLEDTLYDDFKDRVNSGEIVISTEGYEDLPRGSKETQAEEDAFEQFVKDNKDLVYEILGGLSPVEEGLHESKKSLKESAYDVYQDILERAKSNIDDGYTSVDEAIWNALDNGLIYTDDEFEVLKDIFSCDDLYTEQGENVRTYIDEQVFNQIYGDIEEYLNSKKEQGEVEESCKKEATKKAPEITEEQKACKDEECKKKELDESLTVICDFDDYSPWSGAVSTYEKIEEEGKLDDLENLLEECYPEGMTMTAINDILWFDADWVFESLGITDEEEEEDEDEEEDDFDESLFEGLVNRYCNRVYENVDTYKATSCSREKGNFIVEGVLTYKNGKQEPTTFTFVENKTNNNTTLYMGVNETFSPSKRAYALSVTRDGNKLLSESLRYNYTAKVSNQNYPIKGKVITPKKK